ncbi:MAG: methionine--tRNA ligase [Planctomycetota bacterium]|jgi:methionyl-tRNA synthetase
MSAPDQQPTSTDSRPLIVTSALPYANGPQHFGHLAGAYLPADLYVRHQRLARGLGMTPRTDRDPGVIFICGTDEHGVAITVNAEREGMGYQAYVDHWHEQIRSFMDRFSISFDHFSRTTNKDPHYPLSQEFFLRLLRSRNLKRQDVQQLYSPKTERFLADRYVRGTCYLCGHAPARGDECPACGAWLDATQLIDPVSAEDPEDRLELRSAWQFELDMSPISGDDAEREAAYGPDFVAYLDRMREHLKPNVRATMFDKLIDGEGLRGRPITRDLPWGVPLPETDLDGASLGDVSGKVLYVWFDAPIGYITSTIEWARDLMQRPALWRRYWITRDGGAAAGEPSARLVHFIGKDNIPFHGIVFPAMLAGQAPARAEDTLLGGAGLIGPGAGERYVLPDNVPANEFYNLEGGKFSTSDKRTLDTDRMIERFGVDPLRWYLTRTMPETADSQFTFAGLQTEVNLLADVLGNYASRVLKFIGARLGGSVPEPEPTLAPEQLGPPPEGDAPEPGAVPAARWIHDHDKATLEGVGAALEAYKFRVAADLVLSAAREGNQLFDGHAPWKTRKTDEAACRTALYCHVQLLACLSVAMAPIMPERSAELRRMLVLPPVQAWTPSGRRDDDCPTDIEGRPDHALPPGHALGEPSILFAKIPDEVVEEERAALAARAATDC